MTTNLDLDDVAATSPAARAELDALRAEVEAMTETALFWERQTGAKVAELLDLRAEVSRLRQGIWENLPLDPGNDTHTDRKYRALLITGSEQC